MLFIWAVLSFPFAATKIVLVQVILVAAPPVAGELVQAAPPQVNTSPGASPTNSGTTSPRFVVDSAKPSYRILPALISPNDPESAQTFAHCSPAVPSEAARFV